MFLVRNRGINRLRQCQRRLSKHQTSPSNHLTSPKRKKQGHMRLFVVNPHVYIEMAKKTACMRDCEFKTRVQEERCIKLKENRQAETKFTPMRLPGKHAPRPDIETREKEQFKFIECRENNPQRTTTRNSPAESPILLRREIPMAWGTITDNLNP